MTAPTRRQLEIHTFMLEHQREHGSPPTSRETATALGIASTNAIHEQLVSMKAKGLVRHRPRMARGWFAIEIPKQEAA